MDNESGNLHGCGFAVPAADPTWGGRFAWLGLQVQGWQSEISRFVLALTTTQKARLITNDNERMMHDGTVQAFFSINSPESQSLWNGAAPSCPVCSVHRHRGETAEFSGWDGANKKCDNKTMTLLQKRCAIAWPYDFQSLSWGKPTENTEKDKAARDFCWWGLVAISATHLYCPNRSWLEK